jgi:two-component system sensor histidine kinase/response regulator
MRTRKMTKQMSWMGAVDWNRRLFDARKHITNDDEKTRDQLIYELTELRQRVTELETSEAECKHFEKVLNNVNQQLKEANARKDRFFSIIAHDLRNPFHGLFGITETIVQHIENLSRSEIKTFMHEWRTAGEAVQVMLENLLAWSKLQQGEMTSSPEQLSFKSIVDHNISLFTPVAQQKQITLQSLVQKNVAVYADRNMLDTVIRNLLSNALKFTHAGGSIEISAQQSNQHVEVALSDTGIGIHERDLTKLFQIDQKYTCVGTSGEKGTGLGLILCKDLIERNGGKIWVNSKLGKGSTFQFLLPAPNLEHVFIENIE